jgi:hypothetical protein
MSINPFLTMASISDYLTNTNVQLGASYSVGQASSRKFAEGYAAAAKYINASPKEVGKKLQSHETNMI